MANKRNFKKRVRSICGDLASDALIASVLFKKEVSRESVNEIINDIAELQESTFAKATFSFDKGPREYESLKDYHRDHRKYYAEAYTRLNKEFIDRAIEIVKRLNDVVPAEARKVVSSI